MRLLIYSNRHAKEQVHNLQDNDYLVLQDSWAVDIWNWVLDYNNINKKINIILLDELLGGRLDNMTFDYILQNPPYQKQVGPTKTEKIWQRIIVKTYSLLRPGGTMTSVHPSAWRFVSDGSRGDVKEIQNIYKTNKITHMELHDYVDGVDNFGASTDYDIVTLVKEPYNGPGDISTKSGTVSVDLSLLDVIPTDRFDLYLKLIANKGESKVEMINDSNYHTSNGMGTSALNTNKDKNETFKYPVIYTITENDGVVLWYANTNNKGHFGIPKLILKKGSIKSILDINGEYGMTQFASAIVDEPENLIRMQKALESKEFKELKGLFCGIGPSNSRNAITDGLGTMFKFIKSFKKDFWKEFYTDEMEQELIKEGKLNAN